MPLIDDIRAAIRDFTRYTGDGLPNAPVGAPLPTGDPQSGIHNISKADLRDILIAILQAQGDPDALQDILEGLDAKADILNSGKIIGSRAAAEAMGQTNLPSTLGLISVREGDYISYRGFGVSDTAADPLFPTLPYWGIIFRVPSSDLLVSSVRISGVIPLEGVSGTANSITANIQASLLSLGVAVGPLSKVEITPTSTNTGAVTLTVAGDVARAVLTENGVALSAGALVSGRTYQLRRRGNDYRVMIGSVTSDDFTSAQADIAANRATLDPIAGAIQVIPDSSSVLVAVRDSDGNGTFMTARSLDGGPTREAALLIGTALQEAGQIAGAFRPLADGTWAHPDGGRFARADANMNQIVAWGSSSTVFSDTAWGSMAAELGATYVPLGAGGATNEHVMIQLGVVKPSVVGGTLAAGAGSSAVVTVETIATARQSAMRSTPGLLVNGSDQIPVTLSYNGTALQVVRSTAGASVNLATGWRFWSDSERLRNRMALIWSGKNDLALGQDAASVSAEVRRIVNYMSPMFPRYLVIGHFPSSDNNSTIRAQITAANDLMATTYGDLFVPVMPSLLGTQIFTDLGLTATSEDIAARAAGMVPPSLLMDPFHLTSAAYGWITTNLIRPKLITTLGWYKDPAL